MRVPQGCLFEYKCVVARADGSGGARWESIGDRNRAVFVSNSREVATDATFDAVEQEPTAIMPEVAALAAQPALSFGSHSSVLCQSDAVPTLVASIAARNSAIASLSVANNPSFGDRGAEAIARVLAAGCARSLRTIDMQGAGVTSRGANALGQALLRGPCTAMATVLDALDLRQNNTGTAEDCPDLAKAARRFTALIITTDNVLTSHAAAVALFGDDTADASLAHAVATSTGTAAPTTAPDAPLPSLRSSSKAELAAALSASNTTSTSSAGAPVAGAGAGKAASAPFESPEAVAFKLAVAASPPPPPASASATVVSTPPMDRTRAASDATEATLVAGHVTAATTTTSTATTTAAEPSEATTRTRSRTDAGAAVAERPPKPEKPSGMWGAIARAFSLTASPLKGDSAANAKANEDSASRARGRAGKSKKKGKGKGGRRGSAASAGSSRGSSRSSSRGSSGSRHAISRRRSHGFPVTGAM